MIAADANDMTQQLIRFLGDSPDEETLAYRAAAILGCDVLDTRHHPHQDIVRSCGYPTTPGRARPAFYIGTRVTNTALTEPAVIDSVSQRSYGDLRRALHDISTQPRCGA